MKNADDKAVAGTVAWSMRDNLREKSHPTQRGFVPGRSLTRNAVELDAYARTVAAKAEPDDFAVLLFFDVEAAFPSACSQFLRMATRLRCRTAHCE